MPPKTTVSEPKTEPPRSRPAGRSVLVADDDPLNRQLTQRMLEARGWSVAAVADGQAALDRVAGERFDLVLLDVEMPGLDGPEVAARIRAQERRRPGAGQRLMLVALSAHRGEAERRRCLAAGMDGYLSKPLDPDELAALKASGDRPAATAEATAAAAAVGPIDWQRALGAAGGDRELLERLAASAAGELRRRLADLAEAIAGAAPESARRAAHTLHGVLRIFGAARTRELAAELEAGAAAGTLKRDDGRLALLSVQVGAVVAALAEGPPPAFDREEE